MGACETKMVPLANGEDREASLGCGTHGFLQSIQGMLGLKNRDAKNENVRLDVENSHVQRSERTGPGMPRTTGGCHSPGSSVANFHNQLQQMMPRIPIPWYHTSSSMFLPCEIILSLCLNVKHLTVCSSIIYSPNEPISILPNLFN